MNRLSLSLLLAFVCLGAPAAIAQAPAAPQGPPANLPACNGTVTVVRVSEVKPGKTADFLAAVAAQLAWYRKNGVTTNNIYAAAIMVKDDAGAYKYSDTQFMTFHINPPRLDTKLPRGDDAYKAFVTQFRNSSDIKSETTTCTPAAAL